MVAIEAATLLAGAQKGSDIASVQLTAFRKYSAEVMARESTSYDAEKVFIQSIYGCGLFAVMKAAYYLYWTMKYADFVARHPVEGIVGILPQLVVFSPVLMLIEAISPETLDTASEEALEEWKEEEKADPLYHLKPIFEDYWFFALSGIVGGMALIEQRRTSRLKKKAKLMIKSFDV